MREKGEPTEGEERAYPPVVYYLSVSSYIMSIIYYPSKEKESLA
jgi:hypothetical protein